MAPAFMYRILAALVPFFPVRLRARFWLYLRVLGQRRWEGESVAQRVPGGVYVKIHTRLNEGEATRFVGAHTNLPVPIVIDNFLHNNDTFLVTTRVPGDPLVARWSEITSEVETKLGAQLSRILAPLRALPTPSDAVCGFDGGPVYCGRVRLHASPAGPWQSIADFHAELMHRTGGLTYAVPEGQSEAIHEVVRKAHSRPHRLCLTHNDLGPHNILVDHDFNVTGIVDWEACAWMPEYWELTKGTFLPQYRKGIWPRILTAALPMYALEQEAERYILRHRESYF